MWNKKVGFAANLQRMNTHQPVSAAHRIDVCSLEADMAFFEARLCLAAEENDTVYQRAQIKTYKTLGVLLGHELKRLRAPQSKDRSSATA